ncbi:myosin-8-like [Chironomus tepperi]|uniref:myosin-8-like n=1 Tax=Chironomus tepperi TaxID=113505 RepID=UPI00391F2861
MERVYNSNRLQTLQVYKKPDKIPSESRFKKLEEELREVRIRFPMPVTFRHPEKAVEGKVLDIIEGPKIKSIELQNKLRRIENHLSMCVNDFRDMIERVRELDRLLPKNQHSLTASELEAKENVEKVVQFEDIKEKIMDEYKNICIRFEESDEKSKKQIRKLETKLGESEAKIECLEFEVKKLKKHLEK